MTISILNEAQVLAKLKTRKNAFFSDYYAFYSSWYGGVITNPHMMLLPMDDHMVHRGDGVFEAMKCVGRSVYLMDEHLQRLFSSAEKIFLKPSVDYQQLKEIILQTLKIANQDAAIIRIFLSRGPGNFSVNPYDAIQSQLYIIITRLHTPLAQHYEHGVTVGKGATPAKISWLAQVKSCNYLPNVLMKKEAVDRGFDYIVATDEQNNITESATENIMIVDASGAIIYPTLEHILKGTTMVRACELARTHGIVTKARPISIQDIHSAREVIITGTSVNILPVNKFEDHIIGNGKPGPIAQKLQELMLEDIRTGPHGTPF